MKKKWLLLTLLLTLGFVADVGDTSVRMDESLRRFYGMYYAYPQGVSGGAEVKAESLEGLELVRTEVATQWQTVDTERYGYKQLAIVSENGASMQAFYNTLYNAAQLFVTSGTDVQAQKVQVTVGDNAEPIEMDYYILGEYDHTGISTAEALAVWSSFRNDYPEYYWLSSDILFTSAASKLYLIVFPEYSTVQMRADADALITASLAKYKGEADKYTDALDKVYAIHNKICADTFYEWDAENIPSTKSHAHNIVGVMDGIETTGSVCEGYAKTFQYILNNIGIENIYVTGESKEQPHAWNYVKLGGEWRAIDVTWDDTSETSGENGYWYFGVAKDAFAQTHTPGTSVPNEAHPENFLYELPELSDISISLVKLYGGEYDGLLCYNIQDAFAKMTDPEADYTVELVKNSQNHAIGGTLPTVKSITIKGTYQAAENGYVPTNMYLYVVDDDNTVALNSNLILEDIILKNDGQTEPVIDCNGKTLTVKGNHFESNVKLIGDGVLELATISNSKYNAVFNKDVSVKAAIVGIDNYKFADGVNVGVEVLSVKEGTVNVTSYMMSPFTGLKTVNIPLSASNVDIAALDKLVNLEAITVADGNEKYYSIDGVLYQRGEGYVAIVCYPDKKQGASFDIPRDVTEIEGNAFNGVVNLNTIKAYYNCAYITAGAFANSTSLLAVYLPTSVNFIEPGAFANSPNVKLYCVENSTAHTRAMTQPEISDRIEFVTEHTYIFKDENGEIIKDAIVDYYGAAIAAPEVTPEKAADIQYTYAFEAWKLADGTAYTSEMTLTGDMVFTAAYKSTIRQYTYTFLADDGETVILTATEDYGTTIVPPQAPAKDETPAATYTFEAWKQEDGTPFVEGVQLAGDVIYKAAYIATPKKYTYTFYDEDGTTVLKTETLEYGSAITAPEAPQKPATQEEIYTFAGWSGYTQGMLLEADVSFVAKYDAVPAKYTYVFYNDEAKTQVIAQGILNYGDTIPHPADPTKDTGDGNQYIFTGWTGGYTQGMILTQNAEFVAQYEVFSNPHKYEFCDHLGTVVFSGTLEAGEKIPAPTETPVKLSTEQYSYTFAGWETEDGKLFEEGMTISDDIKFVARFEEVLRKYEIIFFDEDGTTVLKKDTLDYGTVITLPEAPTKQPSPQYEYKFTGWTGYTEGDTVKGNKTFTAAYETIEIKHTYKFLLEDGTVFFEASVLHGTVIALPDEAPVKDGHKFVGWSGYTENLPIEKDITFTAVFEALETEIKSDAYNTKDGLLTNIVSGTSLAAFKANINNTLTVTVKDKNGKDITDDNALVGTNCTITLIAQDGTVLQSLVIVVSGDINGDGKLSVTDFVQIKSHLLAVKKIEDAASSMAADLDGSGSISVTDFVRFKSEMLK